MDNVLDNKKEKTVVKKKKIVRKKKTKGISFKKFLAIYSIVLGAIGVFLLILLFFFLKDYESSIPANKMDKILADMKTSKLESIIEDANIEYNEFEDSAYISTKLKEKIGENELSYSKKLGEYSASNPVYTVSAGDEDLCTISLKKESKKSGFFRDWKLEDVTFAAVAGSDELNITVPTNSTVFLNGIEVSDY
ncbi:hypothetical protein [Lachnospira sp.]|uniref:hypothetical protein n=1 Tax=Lachnospira sp. TaxID=2049031 RepID=UPI00257E86CA|nr:hypothetical protein [Lachnospira sp.]